MPTEKEVWEIIADSWTNLRVKPDKEVIDFSKKINSGLVLDVGCGNGRNSLPFLEKNLKCVAVDYSRGMIREAKRFLKRRGFDANFVVANATNLPFKPGVFHTVIFVRALPHVETRERRLEALSEIKRVGEKIIMSCWCKWDKKLFWIVLKHLFSSDVYVDWNYHGKIYKRFHHLYIKKELEEDLEEVRFKNFKIWDDKRGNIWCLI
jgi:ubiquinone/menaquinone biosynthesis C-methylase UbiE